MNGLKRALANHTEVRNWERGPIPPAPRFPHRQTLNSVLSPSEGVID